MEEPPGPLQQSQSAPGAPGAGVAPHATPAWPRGRLVRVRGDRWRVEGGRAFPGCHLLRLAGIGRTNRGRHVALLWPFDRPRLLDASTSLRRVGWRRWLHVFRALVVAATPCGRMRTACTARIELHPYQLEPALALANGLATRLLLADEVGLGKTIQAGLIVSEMRAREQATRALILTPAGLRDQWALELRDRFAIDATVVDAAMIRTTIAQIAPGTNPWSVWPVVIASLDFVKRPEVLRALDPFTWDALLVDEAHVCASAPERSAAVRKLAARARHVVLLTATPHAGDDQAFAALCRIGQMGPADPVAMFRRGRPDVGLASTRRVHLLRVGCTDAERAMHRLLERYTRAVWTSAAATGDARLAMIVLRKRALSSAASLARSLERRLEALFDVGPLAAQLSLPFAGSAEPDEQTVEDDEPIGYLAAPGMEGRREREWLARVLDAARRASQHESKFARLTRLLVRAREPAVVFTEYRDTARWLATTLNALGAVVLLHGGLSRAERQDTERAFRSGQADILVATDAAGEGLNLHHRCRLVVNLELPWNPMRLEQRIGRVDRLGQPRRPHAIHLVGRGTAEERIVWRLVLRQERARQSVGATSDAVGAAREQDVAEAVMQGGHRLDGHPPDGHDFLSAASGRAPAGQPAALGLVRRLDLREMASDEAHRLKVMRSIGHGAANAARIGAEAAHRSIESVGPWLSMLPRRRAQRSVLPSGLVCVFVVRLVSADRDVLEESLVTLHLDTAGRPSEVSRSDLDMLVGSHALQERVLAAAAARMEAATTVHQRTTLAARVREGALVAVERRPTVALQPGMFDRRVLAKAEQEHSEHAGRESERAERLARLDSNASRPMAAQAELALVLVVD
jgi:superfamily II DNA or RNA helicase